MTPDEMKAAYRGACQQTITVRRYSGTVPNRTAAAYDAAGVANLYEAKDLIGSVKQGDYRVIVVADDLTAAGLSLPVTTNDKVVMSGRELAIVAIAERKSLNGTLIAYELQARG